MNLTLLIIQLARRIESPCRWLQFSMQTTYKLPKPNRSEKIFIFRHNIWFVTVMESQSNRSTHFPMRDLYLYTFQNIMIYWEKLREGWRQRAVLSIMTTAASPTGISVMDGIGYRDISDRSSRWFLLSWEHNVVVLLCLQKNKLLHTIQSLLVDKTLALLK